MATSAKSSNARIEWIVDRGRLKEIGPASPMFTMYAIDTKILKDLLCACSEEIDKAAHEEVSLQDEGAHMREKGSERAEVT